jgi:hypothetical protein
MITNLNEKELEHLIDNSAIHQVVMQNDHTTLLTLSYNHSPAEGANIILKLNYHSYGFCVDPVTGHKASIIWAPKALIEEVRRHG